MKHKKQNLRYYIEPIGEEVNLYAIPNEERVQFWISNPLAKEVDKKVYDELIKRLHNHEQKQRSELTYNK